MIRIGFIIDPIQTFNVEKDSTIAMILAAMNLGWQVYCFEPQHLHCQNGQVSVQAFELIGCDVNVDPWYRLSDQSDMAISEFDLLIMRKDPPFDMQYIYATYLLELAEQQGVVVLNKPSSIRDCNEKLFINWFPQCITDTLVTADQQQIRQFLSEVGDIIVKPLDGMGGQDIFRLQLGDPNVSVILQYLTNSGLRHIMAQRYLPEVKQGDKRILMIGGEPVDYALARIPAEGEARANLAAGGQGKAIPLTERDLWLCQQVGPMLKKRGLWFVGLDVIGHYITEINVTSPTCIRQLDQQCGLNIGDQFLRSSYQAFVAMRYVKN